MNGLDNKKMIAITFDVDMVNYVGAWSHINELDECFPAIREILQDFPQVKTTWFIRIDSQIESLYGRPDFIFHRSAEAIDWLCTHGHQIGWHHHAYRLNDGVWSQEIRKEIVTREIRHFGELAHRLGMSTSRMGWGWQSNESMCILNEIGFKIDSSCIPRPQYSWEKVVKDWSRSPSYPYNPSQFDYQTPGHPSLSLLEIPMSMAYIPAPGDNEKVLRYMNLAYRWEVFARALRDLDERDLLVTITHPYELLRNSKVHPLIAFDMEALRMNLTQLASFDAEFVTLEEAARHYRSGARPCSD